MQTAQPSKCLPDIDLEQLSAEQNRLKKAAARALSLHNRFAWRAYLLRQRTKPLQEATNGQA
jgi:hypothetical protein